MPFPDVSRITFHVCTDVCDLVQSITWVPPHYYARKSREVRYLVNKHLLLIVQSWFLAHNIIDFSSWICVSILKTLWVVSLYLCAYSRFLLSILWITFLWAYSRATTPTLLHVLLPFDNSIPRGVYIIICTFMRCGWWWVENGFALIGRTGATRCRCGSCNLVFTQSISQ